MLIAISGAQGSGKTTVLNSLTRLGFNTIKRKTARSVLAEYPGKTLVDIYNTPDLAVEFQTKILEQKLADEREALISEQLWFTERSYADVFAYALMALGKDNSKSEWLYNYYEKCLCSTREYLHTFYITAGTFLPQSDGVRATNLHFAKMMDVTTYAILWDMLCQTEYLPSGLVANNGKLTTNKITSITTTDIPKRVQQITTIGVERFMDQTVLEDQRSLK